MSGNTYCLIRNNVNNEESGRYAPKSSGGLFICQLLALALFILLTFNVPTTTTSYNSNDGSTINNDHLWQCVKQLAFEPVRATALTVAGIITLLAVKRECQNVMLACGLGSSESTTVDFNSSTQTTISSVIKQWIRLLLALMTATLLVAIVIPMLSVIISSNHTMSALVEVVWNWIRDSITTVTGNGVSFSRYVTEFIRDGMFICIQQMNIIGNGLLKRVMSLVSSSLSDDIEWHYNNVNMIVQDMIESDMAGLLWDSIRQFAYYFFILGEKVVPLKPYIVQWSESGLTATINFIRHNFWLDSLKLLSPNTLRALITSWILLIPSSVMVARLPIHHFSRIYNIDIWAIGGFFTTSIYVISYLTLDLIKDISSLSLSYARYKWPHLIELNSIKQVPLEISSTLKLQFAAAIVTTILISLIPPGPKNSYRNSKDERVTMLFQEDVFDKGFDIGSNDVIAPTCPSTEGGVEELGDELEESSSSSNGGQYSSIHRRMSNENQPMPEIHEGSETERAVTSNNEDVSDNDSHPTSIEDEEQGNCSDCGICDGLDTDNIMEGRLMEGGRRSPIPEQYRFDDGLLDEEDETSLSVSGGGGREEIDSLGSSSSSSSSSSARSRLDTERKEGEGTKLYGPEINRTFGYHQFQRSSSSTAKRSVTTSDYSAEPILNNVNRNSHSYLRRHVTDSAGSINKSGDLLPSKGGGPDVKNWNPYRYKSKSITDIGELNHYQLLPKLSRAAVSRNTYKDYVPNSRMMSSSSLSRQEDMSSLRHNIMISGESLENNPPTTRSHNSQQQSVRGSVVS